MSWIVGLLALLLGGIAFLAHAYQIGAMDQTRGGYQSVLSQLTGAVIGRGWFYKLTIASILAVLCLSANTSFVGFPRLCQLIATDDFLPRAFAALGRRLVYSVGVVVLGLMAAVLLTVFGGITDKLIPLYAVGAFLAFTLSQSGMVMHWRKQKDARHTKLKISINTAGAVATAFALVIILIAKFIEGAWITVIAIPLMLALFWFIHRHYAQVDAQIEGMEELKIQHNDPPVVLIPVHHWGKPIAKSIRLALLMSKDVIAIHLSKLDGDEANDEQNRMKKEWAEKVESPARQAGLNPPKLEFAKTPYREFITPLLAEIDNLKQQFPNRKLAVIVTELVEKHWWLGLLHSRRASRLRNALHTREDPHVVVIDLPWFVQDSAGHRTVDKHKPVPPPRAG